ncbi:hypothetical protein TSUD_164440 [Trifolium subterraneum]|uniref:Uncharacterized protein n=1 Tax=Trifolium subterraneum TaxID=3900 RepID=A0A2Z6MAM9_TRISU|nr:hypothetical protein TSUD_164440 [Trifolium subterraneum]
MASIPVFSPFTNIKLNLHQPLVTSKPLLISRSCFSFQRVSKGGSVSRLSCSSESFHRRVGFNNRQGKSSFLESVDENESVEVVSERDWSQILSALLPFVVAVTAVAALSQPSTFTWVSKELYAPALGGIMLSIGIKLSVDDFALAFKRPLPLSIGLIAQYVLKPLLGVLIAKAFGLPRMFYAGFVLTACVSGAQLSSYASFISKGDVALCIVLTSYSTIASPVVSILRPVMPFVAMICTSMCIGSPLAINRSQILSGQGLRLVAPVLIFHAAAFTLGYWFSNLPSLRQEEQVSRTISLCTGMQSSTLAGLLATQFLGSSQAVPAACSVVAMAIMGLCLASFWGKGFEIRNLFSSSLPSLRTDSAFES